MGKQFEHEFRMGGKNRNKKSEKENVKFTNDILMVEIDQRLLKFGEVLMGIFSKGILKENLGDVVKISC